MIADWVMHHWPVLLPIVALLYAEDAADRGYHTTDDRWYRLLGPSKDGKNSVDGEAVRKAK